jgi:hypothetical protein
MMGSGQPKAPHAVPVQNTIDDLRFRAIEEFSDLIESYARSSAEAAYRKEKRTLRCHLDQLRMATSATLQIFNSLGKSAGTVE